MTRKDFAGSPEDNPDAVQISTIHQYKGLENEAVVVHGFAPHKPPKSTDDFGRVDYVARSRARRYLVGVDLSEDNLVAAWQGRPRSQAMGARDLSSRGRPSRTPPIVGVDGEGTM